MTEEVLGYMADTVRVRFAPSPTGEPHVGNIRTALFNWLFARHTGGSFVVRIEDTDQARKVDGALESILASLRWLGLDWDEGPESEYGSSHGDFGPYFQSERLPLYHDAVKILLAKGDAYQCFCTPERLDAMRKEQQRNQQPPGYDRHCLIELTREERELRAAEGPHVVRYRIPTEGGTVIVNDFIRGDVAYEPALLDDFVILKSDGFPHVPSRKRGGRPFHANHPRLARRGVVAEHATSRAAVPVAGVDAAGVRAPADDPGA